MLDKWTENRKSLYENTQDVSLINSFKIGLIQCVSMIPGVSRSAATIFGGIFSGFNRRQAAEFSFLLAIPTMFAASGKDLWENREMINMENIKLLLFGGVISFVVALVAVKAFVAYLTKNGFKAFGYYRIIVGVAFLVYAISTGLTLQP